MSWALGLAIVAAVLALACFVVCLVILWLVSHAVAVWEGRLDVVYRLQLDTMERVGIDWGLPHPKDSFPHPPDVMGETRGKGP